MNRPPGPDGVRRVTDVLAFAGDPPAYLESLARTYGDVVSLPEMFGRRLYLVSDPELVHDVLLATNRRFAKGYDRDWTLQRLLGQGLITSEGAQWRRQRRRSQPAFHRGEVETFGRVMVDLTDRMIDNWVDDQPRDLHADLLQLTMEIIARTLFAVDLGERVAEVSGALSEAMDAYHEQMTSGLRGLAAMALARVDRQPKPRRFRRATERIDDAVADLVAERARRPAGPDLLSQLLAAHGGPGAPELHDEVKSLLLAGHETTANALSWTIVLLSRHPEVVARLRAELDHVLGDRRPSTVDVADLAYTAATVDEAMRVRPPVWIVSREATTEVTLGGHRIPAGSEVLLSQWVLHRDPRWYDEPEHFRPERWLDGLAQRLPKGAWFPFAGGPRTCIGNHFALLEARLLLARILQRVTLQVAGGDVRPQPSITLRPAGGVPVRPRTRRAVVIPAA